MRGERIVTRARELIGVRFRPQGRSAEFGLDCIGVAAMATGVRADRVPKRYNLRYSDVEKMSGEFVDLGFVRTAPTQMEAGDVVIVRAGHGQLHIVILTPEGYLHADAGLGLVIEVPGPLPWPVLSAWRHPDECDYGAATH